MRLYVYGSAGGLVRRVRESLVMLTRRFVLRISGEHFEGFDAVNFVEQ